MMIYDLDEEKKNKFDKRRLDIKRYSMKTGINGNLIEFPK
jgi:hypothetical protein